MADPWELILDHPYTGTPGVVYDHSPGQGSHGVAVNLADGDFLSNGASPGSGAVNFQPDSMIRVPAGKSWRPLRGLRAEVVCIRDGASFALIDGGSFKFYIRGDAFGAWFSAYPYQFAEIVSKFDGFDPTFTVPTGQWMTLGFMHDGASAMELYFNGDTVARISAPLRPINSTTSVTIGNFSTGAGMPGMSARIDDVKIWRINPHRVDEEFTDRPVDESVKQCWAQWSRTLGAVLSENGDCAVHLRDLLVRAIDSLIRDGLNHGDQTRARWENASDTYRQLWSEGNLADIVPMMADLVSYLQLTGLDPSQNPDVVALLNDSCLQTIAGQTPRMYCDPQFTDMIGDLANTIENRNRNQHITTQVREV